MSVDPFERLLGSMPQIAEAVNAFHSEDVQRQAFAVLLKTLGAITEYATDIEPDQLGRNGYTSDGSIGPLSGNNSTESATSKTRSARRVGSKRSWIPSKGIDFFPQGKISLRDFAGEKQPASNYDKYVVAGYYLTEHLGCESFTVEDLLAAFQTCKWRPPADPGNILSKTGSKGWLNTNDTSAISISLRGRSVVDHDMPPTSKKK